MVLLPDSTQTPDFHVLGSSPPKRPELLGAVRRGVRPRDTLGRTFVERRVRHRAAEDLGNVEVLALVALGAQLGERLGRLALQERGALGALEVGKGHPEACRNNRLVRGIHDDIANLRVHFLFLGLGNFTHRPHIIVRGLRANYLAGLRADFSKFIDL